MFFRYCRFPRRGKEASEGRGGCGDNLLEVCDERRADLSNGTDLPVESLLLPCLPALARLTPLSVSQVCHRFVR